MGRPWLPGQLALPAFPRHSLQTSCQHHAASGTAGSVASGLQHATNRVSCADAIRGSLSFWPRKDVRPLGLACRTRAAQSYSWVLHDAQVQTARAVMEEFKFYGCSAALASCSLLFARFGARDSGRFQSTDGLTNPRSATSTIQTNSLN